MTRRFTGLASAIAFVLLSAPAIGGPEGPPLPLQQNGAVAQRSSGAAHPDLSGYWELRFDSFNVPRATLTPRRRRRWRRSGRRTSSAIRGCINVGMPAVMNDHATLDIRQSPSVIGMVAKSPSSTRYIYTDGRKHPDADELETTTNGHSIGRWDGQNLLVDTIGMNDRGITAIPGGGYSHHQVPPRRAVPPRGRRAAAACHVHMERCRCVQNAALLRVPVLQGPLDFGAAGDQLHPERCGARTISDGIARPPVRF